MKKFISLLLAAAAVASCVSCAAISADAATIKGDLNGDNLITLRDAAIAQKIDVGLISPTSEQSYSGDMDDNGSVGAADSLIIQKYVCLDSTTLDNLSPNRVQRIKFIDKINADRVAAGVEPFEYTDAHLEAGNIRAKEYLATDKSHARPDGRLFITILEECNLPENPSPTEAEYGAVTGNSATDVYKAVKQHDGDEGIYTLLLDGSYKTLCVGSVPSPTSTRQSYWIVLID